LSFVIWPSFAYTGIAMCNVSIHDQSSSRSLAMMKSMFA
jgi:hypothetical protein